jgi:hypothetical protein
MFARFEFGKSWALTFTNPAKEVVESSIQVAEGFLRCTL